MAKIKTVLFDLDGTLLPMDQDVFVKSYFGFLAKLLAPHGYEPKKLIDSIWQGTKAMVTNNGEMLNADRFWQVFGEIYGEKGLNDTPLFEKFYREDFQKVKDVCGFNSKAGEVVKRLKDAGVNLVLATNPIFPEIATLSRIGWAGLDPKDFSFITVYENSSFCKPNRKYYQEIIEKLSLDPSSCLMVGNDVDEDMVCKDLGMKVFLLTDCLINKQNVDISVYEKGDFDKLNEYLDTVL